MASQVETAFWVFGFSFWFFWLCSLGLQELSSPLRDWTGALPKRVCGVLTTGPPGGSLNATSFGDGPLKRNKLKRGLRVGPPPGWGLSLEEEIRTHGEPGQSYRERPREGAEKGAVCIQGQTSEKPTHRHLPPGHAQLWENTFLLSHPVCCMLLWQL